MSYVVFSYVWGNYRRGNFKTQRSVLNSLMKPGGLKKHIRGSTLTGNMISPDHLAVPKCSMEFVAIPVGSIDLYHGEITFAEIFRLDQDPGKEYEFYNMIRIIWRDGVAYRKGIDCVKKRCVGGCCS
jgi:hypothetical protein